MSNRITNELVALASNLERNLSSDLWAEYEVHFWAGDSQALGQNTDTAFSVDLDDTPPGIVEMSQGVARTGVEVPPDGELMPLIQPSQQDIAGSGDIGPMLAYLRKRKQLFPGIKKMFVVGAAVGGSSFNAAGQWGSGGAMRTQLIADLNAILGKYPEAVPVSGLISLGTVDSTNVQTDPAYSVESLVADFQSLISDIRTSLPGGEKIAVALVGLPTWFLGGGAQYVNGERAIRFVAENDPQVAVVEVQDLDRSDLIHFDGAGYRAIGQRAAVALASLTAIPYRTVHRFRYDPFLGEMADIWGRAAEMISPTFTRDSERGVVLDFSGTGILSTCRLPDQEYTISMKVRPTATTGFRNLAGYRRSGDTVGMSFNLASAFASVLHEGATTAGNTFNGLGSMPPINTWSTVGATWKAGEGATLYLDGASVGTVVATSNPDMGSERELLFGAFDPSNLSDNAFTGQMDDIVIVDRALSADGMARLHWG